MHCWRLDDGRQTLALASRDGHLPEVVYWGAPLPPDEDCDTLARAGDLDVTGGMLDANPELTLCPEASRSFPGQPGLIVRRIGVEPEPLLPRFQFTGAQKSENALTLIATDTGHGLTWEGRITLDPDTHVITLTSALRAEEALHLHWLAAPVLPAPQLSDEMIDVTGRWCGEFQLTRTAWSPGIRYRENRTGRTGHEHFPGLIVPGRGATNTQGEAWAFHYGWSGGHRMIAEELPDGRRQVQFGHAARLETEAATEFHTAPLYAVYSSDGLNGCAVSFQRHLRDRIVTPTRPDRPVHYNCWEAVYFDHRLDVLQDIATRVADLGAERFVLDDGWFGQRDDDTSSLADWTVDPRKYPEGLDPLIAHVRSLGMTFGIWFEPEMINTSSRTYEAHPDWLLGPADQIPGRQQMVLDMSRADVRDYLFERISEILSAHRIEYIKWDHNRVLPAPDARQTRGSYALIDRLRAAHPHVEIESCASGGGRIDFGILSRTQRVWLSDSNDALERLKMQANAALFLPASVTGSHVGPRRCHTSGRCLDISFRAWVAAQRHMGFEMDPRELTDHEAEVLKDVTAWWKANRDWLFEADILRLDSPDPTVIAEEQLARSGARFVVFAGRAAAAPQIVPRPLRLTRLQPAARYRISLRNRVEAPGLSRGTPILKTDSVELSGAALMSQGVTLPWSFPETMWVVEGKRL